MIYDDLEAWAYRAMDELQTFCDEAQAAEGNPDGDDCLAGTRALMAEFDLIKQFLPLGQSQIIDNDVVEENQL